MQEALSDIQLILIFLHNADARTRGEKLKELKAQGMQVEFKNMRYSITDSAGQVHHLPSQTCTNCHKTLLLSEFFGSKNVQPWCKSCRELDPVGAKRERDRMLQRFYPKEKRRAKEQRQQEKHPQWRRRTEVQLQREARALAVKILDEYAAACVEQLSDEYPPGQRQKIFHYLNQISRTIAEQPERNEEISELASELRKEAQRILAHADAIEQKKEE